LGSLARGRAHALRRALVLLFMVGIPLGTEGCRKHAPPPPGGARRVSEERAVLPRATKTEPGFRLSDADPEPPVRKEARATPLGDGTTRALLGRLPPMSKAPEVKASALRDKSIPAPRPGETKTTAFPPSVPALTAAPAATGQTCVVERFLPEGDVQIAPQLSVTFSAPMVELTSHAELGRHKPPVELVPLPPGHWRWIGTQTVLFDPEHERFPMATDYTVTVPRDTRSAAGVRIGAEKRWRFSTPAVTVEQVDPTRQSGPQGLEPILFASFDQRIQPERVLGKTKLRRSGDSSGAASFALRLATADEVARDSRLRSLVQSVEPGRWLAFRAKSPLPKATDFSVVFEVGLPSAEGPKLTTRAQEYSFGTYRPLALDEMKCAWGNDACPPLAPWNIHFNNPIDAASVDPALVRVEPRLGAMKVEAQGDVLVVRGRSKGRTKYSITVLPGLRDTFGQRLEAPVQGRIQVDSAEPVLFAEQLPMVVADPAFPDRLAVFSINHPRLRVRLYRVKPADWMKYLEFREDWDIDRKVTAPPGTLVVDRVVKTRKAPDELVETLVDLGPALQDGHGNVIALVEPTTPPKRDPWGGIQREWVRCWVESTAIGLQAFWDQDSLYGWTSALGDGRALGAVEVSLPGTDSQGRTDPSGLAKLAFHGSSPILVARQGTDSAFLPARNSARWFEIGFSPVPIGDGERWFLFTDRGLYKPGERVYAKGWARIVDMKRGGDVTSLALSADQPVDYVVSDPRGADLCKGQTTLDESQGFHLACDLPQNANLGAASIALSVGGVTRQPTHTFQIQEFRRPEFEVSATVSEGPHLIGGHAVASVTAAYYAGGGLPNAKVQWTVRASEAAYSPPGWSSFSFGKGAPLFWWWGAVHASEPQTWKARARADGTHRLRIDFDAVPPHFPRQVDLEATVTDVNQQQWTARTDLLVHPALLTAGLRSRERVVRAGGSVEFEVIVTDLDGKPVSGRPVEVKGVHRGWDTDDGDDAAAKADAERCNLTSALAAQKCVLTLKSAGEYVVSALVRDDLGRASRSESSVWVTDERSHEGPRIPQGKVELVPDRNEYRGGETARVLVLAPFAPAEGVLTVRRNGVEEIRRVSLRGKSALLDVGLLERYVPNVTVRLDLVGAEIRENEAGLPDPTLPRRPAFASGSTVLRIPPADRTLAIDIAPKNQMLKPGAKARVELAVRDARGQPVSEARLALVVVDESVLALTGYKTPDPFELFYASRAEDVSDLELRWRIALMQPDMARLEAQGIRPRVQAHTFGRASGAGQADHPLPAVAPAPPMGEEGSMPSRIVSVKEGNVRQAEERTAGKKPPAAPLTVRQNWSPLAAFVPDIRANTRGQATVDLSLPDNLTRYRVMAVAASGKNQFGSSEEAVTARLPLMVRASPPRFLNFGDRFELPVVLQNRTSAPLQVQVVARAANLALVGSPGLGVKVPANDRVEVRFAMAAVRPGTARLQLGASSPAGTDASEHELPVWTPATTEAFATYGTVDQGSVAQPVRRPRDALEEWGGLEIMTSSTALQGLTDAMLYLAIYPYECAEQLSSRVLSIAALRDVLDAFHAEGLPSKDALMARVSADLKTLAGRQHGSGGWDWWTKDRNPVPFVSIHVTHALERAKAKGFEVPDDMYQRALGFLRAIESYIPAEYSLPVRRTLIAYALYVRNRAGDRDAVRARRLIEEAGGVAQLPLEAVGLIWPVFQGNPAYDAELQAIRHLVAQKVTETAGAAHFVTGYDDGAYLLLHSDRRVDAILLEALMGDQPQSSLIPKLVAGLLDHRKRGHWGSTQEDAFVLVALDRYFASYENVTPDFVARVWLGDGFAGDHAYKGRSTDRQETKVSMTVLAKQGEPATLILSKEGPGRLYYRLGMQYAPKSLWQAPADHGFAVSRTYEAVDKPEEVRQAEDGVWHIRRGAMVRVRVGMVARARRYHVALVDPMPAGFEPLNPALTTTATIPTTPSTSRSGSPWWWSSSWYEHQNLRDERAEAFASLLWDGVYDYVYYTRATTPGTFIVPAPKAEEMYEAETFGRGASDRVVVE
jgi:alpha-2-macroglobulin